MIDLDKLSHRLEFLKGGGECRVRHIGYGFDGIVKMNPQQNRIYISERLNDAVTVSERDISYWLLWGCGEWEAIITRPTKKIVEIEVPGEYIKI